MNRPGLAGPSVNISDCRRWSSASLATGSHALWSGTPNAPGRSPAASRSEPQNDGRRTGAGAGVTGREGRSNSVGKSVNFMLGRRCCDGSSRPGENIGSSPLTFLW